MSRDHRRVGGGRRITMPSGRNTRPTTDRVREAVFSAIASWAGTADRPPEEALAGLAFCDLYAGSGAVGLEAASRGADPVVLVERDRSAAALVRRNAARARAAGRGPARRRTRPARAPGAETSFDVVFADPPYDVATSGGRRPAGRPRRVRLAEPVRADHRGAVPPDARAELAGRGHQDLEPGLR